LKEIITVYKTNNTCNNKLHWN